MDGTANEHPRGKVIFLCFHHLISCTYFSQIANHIRAIFQPDGYPTLLFYPAGNKSFDPVTIPFLNCFILFCYTSICWRSISGTNCTFQSFSVHLHEFDLNFVSQDKSSVKKWVY
jgi:hypothetical protein